MATAAPRAGAGVSVKVTPPPGKIAAELPRLAHGAAGDAEGEDGEEKEEKKEEEEEEGGEARRSAAGPAPPLPPRPAASARVVPPPRPAHRPAALSEPWALTRRSSQEEERPLDSDDDEENEGVDGSLATEGGGGGDSSGGGGYEDESEDETLAAPELPASGAAASTGAITSIWDDSASTSDDSAGGWLISEVAIPGSSAKVSLTEAVQRPFTVYYISATAANGNTWIVSRRFSELFDFAVALPQSIKRGLPRFPSRFHKSGKFSAALIEFRRNAVEAYLRAVLREAREPTALGREVNAHLARLLGAAEAREYRERTGRSRHTSFQVARSGGADGARRAASDISDRVLLQSRELIKAVLATQPKLVSAPQLAANGGQAVAPLRRVFDSTGENLIERICLDLGMMIAAQQGMVDSFVAKLLAEHPAELLVIAGSGAAESAGAVKALGSLSVNNEEEDEINDCQGGIPAEALLKPQPQSQPRPQAQPVPQPQPSRARTYVSLLFSPISVARSRNGGQSRTNSSGSGSGSSSGSSGGGGGGSSSSSSTSISSGSSNSSSSSAVRVPAEARTASAERLLSRVQKFQAQLAWKVLKAHSAALETNSASGYGEDFHFDVLYRLAEVATIKRHPALRERLLMACSCLDDAAERDRRVVSNLARLQGHFAARGGGIPPALFGACVHPSFSLAGSDSPPPPPGLPPHTVAAPLPAWGWEPAVRFLEGLEDDESYGTPSAKAELVLKCVEFVHQGLVIAHARPMRAPGGHSVDDVKALGADDIVPILFYIMASSRLSRPCAVHRLVSCIASDALLDAQAKYWLTVFESGLHFLASLDLSMDLDTAKAVTMKKEK